ncbi:MAG TPA: ATP-binding protein [Nitrospiraceae bacterium]|nr:ATP-binding protein [Nitrospiraceae bacterium]
MMGRALEQSTADKQSTLQKTLTAALNDLGLDAALVAIAERDNGPLVPQVTRGLTPRDMQAILRALSLHEWGTIAMPVHDSQGRSAGEESRVIRVRMISPGAKSLLATPLRYKQRVYGVLVIGRKETAAFSKKEKAMLEATGDQVTSTLEQASLFDGTVILSRPLVAHEPVPAVPAAPEPYVAPSSYATPAMQERVVALLNETIHIMPFDRAWITLYDPIAGAVEVLGFSGEHRGDPKKDLKAGQRLALDASASGWAVRHRKPRVDHDLASTQGRFQDHKHLYKDRFQSALAVPFFVRGQVGGTVALASKTAMQYSLPEVRTLEPLLGKLAELIQGPPPAASPVQADGGIKEDTPVVPTTPGPSEPMIRKQERQAAIGEFSAFLATEVREPLASICAQLEEVTGAGILDFDSQTRVENAMRDLIRVEAILHEILDFAKPLVLNRRICRITDIIENALTVVATELDVNRIHVTKEYAGTLGPVRCDEGKMQLVFLSIFKNALEAMAPGGHLHIEVVPQRAGRSYLHITIQNDGVPIPTEHVGKVFEPYFTTKRSGTGLGLATVKKIVEEHQGQISIASGPGQGTALIIRLPMPPRTQHYRGRGRGRRPPRR